MTFAAEEAQSEVEVDPVPSKVGKMGKQKNRKYYHLNNVN